MASVPVNLDVEAPDLLPTEVYGNTGPIRLRIATGGAGANGLLRELANAFIADLTKASSSFQANPWRIAWFLSDTSMSYNALANRTADVAITYHPYSDAITVRQGVAERKVYVFRDAFCLVGPASNPAKLPIDSNVSIYEHFAMIFEGASRADTASGSPIRFLSRFDKSANNILESRIWATIGQTPWSDPHSSFYHRINNFPVPSLQAANALGEYCLVDRGSWLSCDPAYKNSLICFKMGAITGPDAAAVDFTGKRSYDLNPDALSNPAHALLGKYAKYKEEGNLFIDWLLRENGGRKVIESLVYDGVQGYGLPPLIER